MSNKIDVLKYCSLKTQVNLLTNDNHFFDIGFDDYKSNKSLNDIVNNLKDVKFKNISMYLCADKLKQTINDSEI